MNPLPTRVSSDPEHPDFHPEYFRILVLVDGVELKDCVHVDTETRAVTVLDFEGGCGQGGEMPTKLLDLAPTSTLELRWREVPA